MGADGLLPFVRPYRRLVIAMLLLTLVGALAAQVPLCAALHRRHGQGMLNRDQGLAQGWTLLAWVSGLLLGKGIINTAFYRTKGQQNRRPRFI